MLGFSLLTPSPARLPTAPSLEQGRKKRHWPLKALSRLTLAKPSSVPSATGGFDTASLSSTVYVSFLIQLPEKLQTPR